MFFLKRIQTCKQIIAILGIMLFFIACGSSGEDNNNSADETTNVIAEETSLPTVSFTIPAEKAANVAIDSAITVTFSDSSDNYAVNTAVFTVTRLSYSSFDLTGASTQIIVDDDGNLESDGFSLVPAKVLKGQVTHNGTTVTFTPEEDLEYDKKYSVTINANLKDTAANTKGIEHFWTFTTAAE